MIAMRILDIKEFMTAFLAREHFDEYELTEAQITTFCTFQIDGRYEREYFQDSDASADEDDASQIKWGLVRRQCFDLIKGKRTPLSFRFVIFYPRDKVRPLLEERGAAAEADNVSGLCLNLRYDGTNLLLTTGCSMKSFSRDRSAENVWDDEAASIMSGLGIACEKL